MNQHLKQELLYSYNNQDSTEMKKVIRNNQWKIGSTHLFPKNKAIKTGAAVSFSNK